MDNTAILREIGFTEGEIKVYYALFELGESTVGPISIKSGVTHAKVYPILDKLIKKGLVSYIQKAGSRHFTATNPDSLLEYVNKRIRNLEGEKTKLNEIIPSLKAKQKDIEQQQYSRVFEGFKGLRSLFIELFTQSNPNDEVCVFGMNEILDSPAFINFFNFYHELRLKNKIGLKLILNKNSEGIYETKYKPMGHFNNPISKVKYLDVTLPVGIFIYQDHVINIIADDKVTAFDIKSKQNAERYRKFFYSIWNKK